MNKIVERDDSDRWNQLLTFPVPPSPTRTSLKVGVSVAIFFCCDEINRNWRLGWLLVGGSQKNCR